MRAVQSRLPILLGLVGLTVGAGTVGFVLEREKRRGSRGNTPLERQINSGNVVMFSKSSCVHCRVAKQLFDKEGIAVRTVTIDKPNDHPDVVDMGELVTELLEKTKCRTVPQIFIRGEFIGGASDLQALRDNGALRPLVEGKR